MKIPVSQIKLKPPKAINLGRAAAPSPHPSLLSQAGLPAGYRGVSHQVGNYLGSGSGWHLWELRARRACGRDPQPRCHQHLNSIPTQQVEADPSTRSDVGVRAHQEGGRDSGMGHHQASLA